MVEPGGEIILYESDKGPRIEVHVAGDTVWLSEQQLSDLFQTSRTNIVEHIGTIHAEGELDPVATCRDFRQVRAEGGRQVARTMPFYKLDMADWVGHLDRMLVAMDAPVLTSAGSVSHAEAERAAKKHLAGYKERRCDGPSDIERAYLDAVKGAQRVREGSR